MPMLYYQGKINEFEQQSQKNLGRFMKVLLVKRLESSFFAFKNSINRFINSYQIFLKELENGYVYTSKKDTAKIFEALQQDNDEALQKLIDKGRAKKYEAKNFNEKLKTDLEHDLAILKNIKELWQEVKRDPKFLKFQEELTQNKILKKNHIIIFTESKETADYLYQNINNNKHIGKALKFTGGSSESTRVKVLENFDANSRYKKNNYRILISTEVLSEGVNLHRSNTIINYDIPWNPTKMMQRAGRINRVDTRFDKIYTFNFFPTTQANDEIGLKEAAKGKINAFLTLLGGDAELLTEGEPVASHQLFDKLVSKNAVEPEDAEESELKYLNIIKKIREERPELFEKIKKLPPKARSAKKDKKIKDHLITYFRKGGVQKFFIAGAKTKAKELDFISAAKIIKSRADTKTERLPKRIYGLLKKNKTGFKNIAAQESFPFAKKGADSAAKIVNILKATLQNSNQLTNDQTNYIKKLITRFNQGGIPKQTSKNCLKELNKLKQEIANPLKTIAVLQTTISDKFLEKHYTDQKQEISQKREVILSLYLSGE
jgi:superfamily II DNA/RNA helicase